MMFQEKDSMGYINYECGRQAETQRNTEKIFIKKIPLILEIWMKGYFATL